MTSKPKPMLFPIDSRSRDWSRPLPAIRACSPGKSFLRRGKTVFSTRSLASVGVMRSVSISVETVTIRSPSTLFMVEKLLDSLNRATLLSGASVPSESLTRA